MSVVMPHFNHGRLIEQAIRAIAEQTMPPFEVVVVDDGSTDGSIARLQTLAADKPWLRIHRHAENRGVNAACNSGLALISGDFVLFSAADDCLSPKMIELASSAVAAFPQTGIVFSDLAEMSIDGGSTRVIPLDMPTARRYLSRDDFILFMQRSFSLFHVSNVWFNVALLRDLGGFPPELRWHGDELAAYACAFERGAVYAPGAVSYFRVSANSYGAAGFRSSAQLDVLRAWLATTRQPGWARRRAAFVAAAIFPEFSLRALRVLLSDPDYLTPRLIGRLVRLTLWTKLAPWIGPGLRTWLRDIRTRYRRRQWRAE
jgi:glycosyltransferase involved in cell wall biosynthesis